MTVVIFDGAEIPVRERATAMGIEYQFPLAIPATGEQVTVLAQMAIGTGGIQPVVHVKDAPDCRRHRYGNHSLCMWYDPDPAEHKWTPADGLDQLVAHIARHLFQEAVCRAGDPWPGEESPGAHPRPRTCRTCGGEGA